MSSPHDMHILTCKLRSRSMPVVEDVRIRVSANINEVDERQYGSVEKLIRAPAEHERPNAPTGHICTVDPKGKT